MKCLKSLLEIIENKSIGINNSGKEQSLSSPGLKVILYLLNYQEIDQSS